MGNALLNSIDESKLWPDDPGKGLINDGDWQAIAEMSGFSARELDVARLLFEGMTREKIADQLGISERTVRHHLEHLHSKLRVKNRVGLVLRVIQVRDFIKRNGKPRD